MCDPIGHALKGAPCMKFLHIHTHTGERWQPIVQRCQCPSKLGALDAHVCNSKPILHPKGLDRVWWSKQSFDRSYGMFTHRLWHVASHEFGNMMPYPNLESITRSLIHSAWSPKGRFLPRARCWCCRGDV